MEEKGVQGMNERELVKNLKVMFENAGIFPLKKVYVHINLATKKFRDIWSEWWDDEGAPPRTEADMILLFKDMSSSEILMVGVEVKFFKDRTGSLCEGLQQALSLGLFGFDSLVLWHIFSETAENRKIDRYSRAVLETIEGLNLSVVYIATKLIEHDKFEFFAPSSLYSSTPRDASFLLSSLEKLCTEKRNPLLESEDVKRRRNVLKINLRIPEAG
jgi:hypothetical protein